MGAPSTLTLEFSAGAWPDGRYEIEVLGEGARSAMCVIDLPDAGLAPACTQSASVALGDGGIVSMTAVEVSGETLQVLALRDGEPLLDALLTPDYTVDEPNGPGCGERYVATIAVAM